MAKVKLHHDWAFYHTKQPTSTGLEDQRVGLGSDMTITQHQLNVLFREMEEIKIMKMYIYLSNLRVKDLEYNNS